VSAARSSINIVIDTATAGDIAVRVRLFTALAIDAIAMLRAATGDRKSDSSEDGEPDFAGLAHVLLVCGKDSESQSERQHHTQVSWTSAITR
jgi:hypothetical protein